MKILLTKNSKRKTKSLYKYIRKVIDNDLDKLKQSKKIEFTNKKFSTRFGIVKSFITGNYKNTEMEELLKNKNLLSKWFICLFNNKYLTSNYSVIEHYVFEKNNTKYVYVQTKNCWYVSKFFNDCEIYSVDSFGNKKRVRRSLDFNTVLESSTFKDSWSKLKKDHPIGELLIKPTVVNEINRYNNEHCYLTINEDKLDIVNGWYNAKTLDLIEKGAKLLSYNNPYGKYNEHESAYRCHLNGKEYTSGTITSYTKQAESDIVAFDYEGEYYTNIGEIYTGSEKLYYIANA